MKLIRSAKAVILDVNNQALLLRRSESHPRKAFDSDLPGGVIEDDESIEAGLLREIAEETGLQLDQTHLKLLHSLTFTNIPGVSISRMLYGARIDETAPDIRLSIEHDEFKWVDISELKQLERPYQHGVDYATKHKLWEHI